jgi:hypothetical protein
MVRKREAANFNHKPLQTREPRGSINAARQGTRLRHSEHHVQLVGPHCDGAPPSSRAHLGPRTCALSLSPNLSKLFDRAPELTLLTSPEDDHTEREDNQER